jgi:hypothetical protein
LIEAGVLDELRLKAALVEQKRWGGRLGRLVVQMGFVDEASMCRVLAQQLRLETIDLDAAALPQNVSSLLRLDLAEHYGVFPVACDADASLLTIATSDPTNVEALQELEFATNLRVVPVVATASAIDRATRRYYFGDAPDPRQSADQAPVVPGETTFELVPVVAPPAASPKRPEAVARAMPPPPPKPDLEDELRKEIALLREQVEGLETIVSSQVRSMRSLLELLIEAGLITRDEYLERLHRAR